MNAVLQLAPHSLDSERSVLGSLLIDNARWDDVSERVSEADFYRADHRTIYRAIADLNKSGAPFDVVTVSEYLERQGQLENAGGLAYLATIARDTPYTGNAGAYAGIVHEQAVKRGVMRIGAKLQEARGDAEAVDTAIRELMALENVGRDWEHSALDMVKRATDEMDTLNQAGTHIIGVRTGLSELDDRLGGFHKGDLVIVGARPAVGKTALMLNWAARCEAAAGVISSEQPSEQLAMRLISLEGSISVHKMRRGKLETDDDWKRVTVGGGRTAKLPLWVNDNPGLHLGDLQRQARKWKHQRDIKILFIDYVQRIKADENRSSIREGVIEVVRGLKSLARELSIPVVALAQVNRDVDKRDNKRPNMGDLQESGAIEQEADQIVMLYRDDAYDEHSPQRGIAELNVAKNRHGPTGMIRVAWHDEFMRFGDLAPRDAWSPP